MTENNLLLSNKTYGGCPTTLVSITCMFCHEDVHEGEQCSCGSTVHDEYGAHTGFSLGAPNAE